MPTLNELGRLVKAKYPTVYDALSDAEVGRRVREKYPNGYGDFVDSLGAGAPSSPQIPPAEGFDYSGLPDEPLQADPLSPLDIPAAIGIARAVPSLARLGKVTVQELLRASGRRAFGKGNFDQGLSRVLTEARRRAPAQRVRLRAPAPRPSPPSRVSGSGSTPKPQATPVYRAHRSGAAPSGASTPALMRRTAARTRAIGRSAAMPDALQGQLAQSLEIQRLLPPGLTPGQRLVATRLLSSGTMPEEGMALLRALLGQ